jgi:hypothetical protein
MEFDNSKKMHVLMRRMRNEEEQLRNHLLVSIETPAAVNTQHHPPFFFDHFLFNL